MKVFVMLAILAFVGGCPGKKGDKDLLPVETHITKREFNNSNMAIGYSSNVSDADFQCQVKITGRDSRTTTSFNRTVPARLTERLGNSTIDRTVPAGSSGAQAGTNKGWGSCATNPLSITMRPGERLDMQVRAVAADGRVDLTPERIVFTHPGNSTITSAGQMITQPVFQVGSAFEFAAPEGMHITQYASTNNYQGAGIELVRLQQGQSYDYLGSYPLSGINGDGCSVFAQGTVQIGNGGGAPLTYCRSFLAAGRFLNLFNGNYARNHIEVASNDHIANARGTGGSRARLLVQIYGPKERSLIRNRFDDICTSGAVVKPISVFHNVKMIQSFWLADEIEVDDTFVCTVSLGGLSGGYYQVGGFTGLTEINRNHNCMPGTDCGAFLQYISVVYMERIAGENGVDHNFARNFQDTLINSLRKNRP